MLIRRNPLPRKASKNVNTRARFNQSLFNVLTHHRPFQRLLISNRRQTLRLLGLRPAGSFGLRPSPAPLALPTRQPQAVLTDTASALNKNYSIDAHKWARNKEYLTAFAHLRLQAALNALRPDRAARKRPAPSPEKPLAWQKPPGTCTGVASRSGYSIEQPNFVCMEKGGL